MVLDWTNGSIPREILNCSDCSGGSDEAHSTSRYELEWHMRPCSVIREGPMCTSFRGHRMVVGYGYWNAKVSAIAGTPLVAPAGAVDA